MQRRLGSFCSDNPPVLLPVSYKDQAEHRFVMEKAEGCRAVLITKRIRKTLQRRSEVRQFENAIHITRVSSSSHCRETPRKDLSTVVIVTTWSKRNNNTSRTVGCKQSALRRKLRDQTSDFLCG